jgi:hypothetical protein
VPRWPIWCSRNASWRSLRAIRRKVVSPCAGVRQLSEGVERWVHGGPAQGGRAKAGSEITRKDGPRRKTHERFRGSIPGVDLTASSGGRPTPGTRAEPSIFYMADIGTIFEGPKELHRHLVRKLQLPHHRLKARLLAQGVHERVGLQMHQTRIPQSPRRLEPFERLGPIAPLRIDRGVLLRRGIALFCLQFRKHSFRIRMPTEPVIDHREALLTQPVVLPAR